jgi:hypothetical protein
MIRLSPPSLGDRRRRDELVGTEEIRNGDRLVTARTHAPGADPATPRVAVLAALFAEVAGVAEWADVDGVRAGHQRLDGGRAPPTPGALAAPGGAVTLAPLGDEGHPAGPTGNRRGIVAHGAHAATSRVSVRSPSLSTAALSIGVPFSGDAPPALLICLAAPGSDWGSPSSGHVFWPSLSRREASPPCPRWRRPDAPILLR